MLFAGDKAVFRRIMILFAGDKAVFRRRMKFPGRGRERGIVKENSCGRCQSGYSWQLQQVSRAQITGPRFS
ncbi:hypothetical protein ACFX2A_038351 [Malus domestica]